MSDTTTPEEKRPLSPAELLEGLKGALFTVTDKYMARGLDMARLKNAASRCRFERNPGQAEKCSRDAKAAERDCDAFLFQMRSLEQSIAALMVITHPDFFQLVDFGEPVDLLLDGGRAYVGIQRHKSSDKLGYAGESVLDALLTAYEALKPREGALHRKEQSDADTV